MKAEGALDRSVIYQPSDRPLAEGIPESFWENGPYVLAACFCEQLLKDDRGGHSLIRLIDGLDLSLELGVIAKQGVEPLADTFLDRLPEFQIPFKLTLFIQLTGLRPGKECEVEIVGVGPKGTRNPLTRQTIAGSGTFSTINLNLTLEMVVKDDGVYLFDVMLIDESEPTQSRLLSTVPLRLSKNIVLQPGEGA